MNNQKETTMLPTSKFQIGQTVWHATITRTSRQLPCPDCFGSKKWEITTPAGTKMTCACQRCGATHSFFRTSADNSIPSLSVQDAVPVVRRLTIGSVRIYTAARSDRAVEYMCVETGIGSGSIYSEARLHESESEALAAGEAMAAAERVDIEAQPRALAAQHFSELTVEAAFLTADWNSVYRAWDHARWMAETIDTVLDDRETRSGKKDEILEYIEDRRSELRRYEFIHKHPFEALIAAARVSTDPVICKVFADLVAKYPLPEPVVAEEEVNDAISLRP